MMKRLLAIVLMLAMLVPAAALADGAEEIVAPARTLELGKSGDDVKDLQQLLIDNGCYTGEVTGKFDKATATAVKSFQRVNRLTVDGKAGKATMARLNSGVAVNAKDVQMRLQDLQYYDGDIDGNFGSLSISAVKAFQKANDIEKANGALTAVTLAALFSPDAIAKGEDAPIVGGTLAIGSYGDAVELLQEDLREKLFYDGKVDGIFGVEVRKAVENFQAAAGLKVDGKYGTASYNALHKEQAAIFDGGIPVRTLSAGMQGWDVKVLQEKLISMNYASVRATGYYDTATANAIKSVQSKNGLNQTGVMGAAERRYIWPTAVDREDVENLIPDKEGDIDGEFSGNEYTRILKKGSTGNDVAMLQMRLKAANYLFGKADGIFGVQTEAAVKKLQKAYGLVKVDGIVGEKTWEVVYRLDITDAEQDSSVDASKPSIGTNNRKLYQGCSGTDVKRLQQKLIQLGFLADGEDDGRFGPITYTAVVNFQAANGLKVDGVAGTETLNELNELTGSGAVG